MFTPRLLNRNGRLALALVFVALTLPAPAAFALRVVDYNILNYPGNSGPARAPYYRTILGPVGADVIVTEEMTSPTGPTEFLNEVLDVMEPGQWATVPFIDGNDTDASLFYKPAKVQFIGQWSFYPNSANHLRLVHVYRVKPVGYTSSSTELRLYTAHLKASTGYENQRLLECTGLRDSMNAMPSGTHALICGDMNFYVASSEPGYAKLLENQTNNNGRVWDILPGGAWHDGSGFAHIHTQSPCTSGACASGGATGGLDDRFDFILPTYPLAIGQSMSVIPGTMVSISNDGLHFNKAITDAPTIPEGADYATAIQLASDHLPQRLDLQLPAMLAANSLLAFGSAIVDAPDQNRNLMIHNPAIPPADSLDCTFTVTDGFTAPGGLVVAASDSLAAVISMSCVSPGQQAGTLTITTDAPDSPTHQVELTGTVLDHAVASLDSTQVVLSGSIDFGDHHLGEFTSHPVRVHNYGYNSLQARLGLQTGVITGGDNRFSFVGGFQPALIAGVSDGYAIAFNDAGAHVDSTYTATLTFGSADEPLPGAIAQPNLVVSLRARLTGDTAAPNVLPLPTATRLLAASPNPLIDRTTIRLEVAQTAAANVAVFDAAGRRVATLRAGTLTPGRYALSWDGRTEVGTTVGSGVYFVRFRAPGMATQVTRVVVVR